MHVCSFIICSPVRSSWCQEGSATAACRWSIKFFLIYFSVRVGATWFSTSLPFIAYFYFILLFILISLLSLFVFLLLLLLLSSLLLFMIMLFIRCTECIGVTRSMPDGMRIRGDINGSIISLFYLKNFNRLHFVMSVIIVFIYAFY